MVQNGKQWSWKLHLSLKLLSICRGRYLDIKVKLPDNSLPDKSDHYPTLSWFQSIQSTGRCINYPYSLVQDLPSLLAEEWRTVACDKESHVHYFLTYCTEDVYPWRSLCPAENWEYWATFLRWSQKREILTPRLSWWQVSCKFYSLKCICCAGFNSCRLASNLSSRLLTHSQRFKNLFRQYRQTLRSRRVGNFPPWRLMSWLSMYQDQRYLLR